MSKFNFSDLNGNNTFILGVDDLTPNGYLDIIKQGFQFRLGEVHGNDTDTLFVVNGKGNF